MSSLAHIAWVATLGVLSLTAAHVAAQPAWDEGSFDSSANGNADADANADATTEQKPESATMPVSEAWGGATDDGGATDEPSEGFEEEEDEVDTPSDETALEAGLLGGFGLGTRAMTYPRELGPGETDTGVDLALEFGLEIGFRTSATRRYGMHGHYQTSSGLRVREQRIAAADRIYRARSHQVRGGFFADLGMGSRASLQLGLDYLARNFSTRLPDVQTPSFTLSGPALVLGLTLHMAEQKVSLRLAPEAQGILQVGDQATERGASKVGLAGGGEASLALRLTDVLRVEAAYYESRARVGSGDTQVKDAIRFITLRLRGAL